jgi:hypothetical protein
MNKEALRNFKLSPEKIVERLDEGRLKDDSIVISSQGM